MNTKIRDPQLFQPTCYCRARAGLGNFDKFNINDGKSWRIFRGFFWQAKSPAPLSCYQLVWGRRLPQINSRWFARVNSIHSSSVPTPPSALSSFIHVIVLAVKWRPALHSPGITLTQLFRWELLSDTLSPPGSLSFQSWLNANKRRLLRRIHHLLLSLTSSVPDGSIMKANFQCQDQQKLFWHTPFFSLFWRMF